MSYKKSIKNCARHRVLDIRPSQMPCCFNVSLWTKKSQFLPKWDKVCFHVNRSPPELIKVLSLNTKLKGKEIAIILSKQTRNIFLVCFFSFSTTTSKFYKSCIHTAKWLLKSSSKLQWQTSKQAFNLIKAIMRNFTRLLSQRSYL